jgi:hypothetical protein
MIRLPQSMLSPSASKWRVKNRGPVLSPHANVPYSCRCAHSNCEGPDDGRVSTRRVPNATCPRRPGGRSLTLLYYRLGSLPHRDDTATGASSFSGSGDGNVPESREGTGGEDLAAGAVPSGMCHAATPWWRRR